MTFDQYSKLSSTEQESLLWSCGVEIASRDEDMYSFMLYQLDGFYIEVQYSRSLELIIGILCFESTKLLDPYLEQMEIVLKF